MNREISKRGLNGRTKIIVYAAVIFLVLLGIYVTGAFLGEEQIAADFSKKALPPSLW